jgi:hypothetical protein
MDSNSKWFFAAILVIVLGLGFIAVVNYIIDPYGIFRKDFSYQFIGPNKHYVKTRYVGEHPDRYDCFVFGSSRANNIDVRKIKDGRCYNMEYSGGLPREHLDNMKYLVRKGVKIKFAIIALDEVAFQDNPDVHLNQPMRHAYPPVLNEPLFTYYLQYLFYYYDWKIMKVCARDYIKRVRGIIKEGPVHYDIFETGQLFSPGEDQAIEKDLLAHANKPEFRRRFRPSDAYMKGVTSDLNRLIEFAQENGIQLKFFIIPLYHTKYLDSGPDELDRFKKALSKMTDFWDFSGLNSITTNKYYYYETWHFRNMVGDMVLSRILGNKDVTVPKDFGIFVTAQNVDNHLQYLKQQMTEYLEKERR